MINDSGISRNVETIAQEGLDSDANALGFAKRLRLSIEISEFVASYGSSISSI
jgi:hypothetical protein